MYTFSPCLRRRFVVVCWLSDPDFKERWGAGGL